MRELVNVLFEYKLFYMISYVKKVYTKVVQLDEI